jgi:hypothetical protein
MGEVFAQMVTGFTLADDPASNVVALNLVQEEDGLSSMQNFSIEMQMLKFLHPHYPHAHVTLHDLGYRQLKTMARTSLEYAFLAGASLWKDARKFVPVAACDNNRLGGDGPSHRCQQFLNNSHKAKLQWNLERQFNEFEALYN